MSHLHLCDANVLHYAHIDNLGLSRSASSRSNHGKLKPQGKPRLRDESKCSAQLIPDSALFSSATAGATSVEAVRPTQVAVTIRVITDVFFRFRQAVAAHHRYLAFRYGIKSRT